MDFIDVKYINQLSSRLLKFKKVKPHLYNFRCPVCGDSQKNKNKARGYLYRIKNNTNFKCHNCGINISFNNFLKEIDAPMHKEYTFEKFKDGHTGKNFVTTSPEDVFKTLSRIYPEGQDNRPFPDHLPMDHGIYVGQIIEADGKPRMNMDVRWEYELRGLPYE